VTALGALKLGSPYEEAKPVSPPAPRLPRSKPQPQATFVHSSLPGGPVNFAPEFMPGNPARIVDEADRAARPTPQPWLDAKTKFLGALREPSDERDSRPLRRVPCPNCGRHLGARALDPPRRMEAVDCPSAASANYSFGSCLPREPAEEWTPRGYLEWEHHLSKNS
jgi:hypothetical protein